MSVLSQKYEQYRKNIDFINEYKEAENASSGSKFDPNANVETKNVATMAGEVPKGDMIGTNRLRIHDKLTEMYDEETADEFLRQLEHHEIYVNDETSLYPYCTSITMYPFLFKGLTGIGGPSVAPGNLDSFCGSFINLVFAISSQFAGACLYKDQRLKIKNNFNDSVINPTAKEFVEMFSLDHRFENYQGEWEYTDISDKNFSVYENGRFVKITKVYRRKYNDKIYRIKSHTGLEALTSKDHKFKTLFRGRELAIPASELLVNDTVFIEKDYSSLIDFSDDEYLHGQLVGYVAGNGYICNKNSFRVAINYDHAFIAERIDESLKKFFDMSGTLKNGHHCYDYQKHSRELVKQIQEEFMPCERLDAFHKNVDLRGKSLNWMVGFLDGLCSSDGSYNGKSIRISLVNRPLLETVKEILSRLDIVCPEITTVPAHDNKAELYTLTIPIRVIKYLELTSQKPTKNAIFATRVKSDREIYYYGKHALANAKGNPVTDTKRITDSKIDYELHSDVIDSIETFDNDDEFVYEIETESHWYNCGGFITHNCSTPELFLYLDYFIRKDYGDDYYLRPTEVVDLSSRRRTIQKVIDDCFQQIVYTLNVPAAARNYQSVFHNVAYFDKPYFEGMFGEFIFPDGTEPKWESLSWLQKHFMDWFNKERTRRPLTFPVETMNLLDDGEKYVDEEWADYTAEMWSKGHSFFLYRSDSVDSLASCCFAPDTKVLAKGSNKVYFTTFKELYEMPSSEKRNFKLFHNGRWVPGKVIKTASKPMYRIVTANKKTYEATLDHLFPTINGLKVAKNLNENDYLVFNTATLDAVNEKDRKLTYEQGLLIGMYLGDGSMEIRDEKYYSVNYSLNENKYSNYIAMMEKGLRDCGIESSFTLHKPYNNVYPVFYYGENLAAFIQEYVSGGYCNTKRLNPEVLLQSVAFRKGILDGIYATDGGNSNRIYTTSEGLAEDIEWLCTSIGLNTIIDVSDRTSEPVVIRGNSYNRNYPLYCVRYYTPGNKSSMDGVYKMFNNAMCFKVESVEPVETSYDNVYCFERTDEGEPYFTFPNGLITHNCRLRNELQDNTFSYTLGAGGVSTGSKKVITINLNRLVQNATKAGIDVSEAVKTQVEKVHKYLLAYNEIYHEYFKAKLLPIYDAGFIALDKQYLTVGLNGFIEGAEFLGIEPTPNEEYFAYAEKILHPIYELNRAARTEHAMFNTELIPSL